MAKAINQVERVTTSAEYRAGSKAGRAAATADRATAKAENVVDDVIRVLIKSATEKDGKTVIPMSAQVAYRQGYVIGRAGLRVFKAGPKRKDTATDENVEFSRCDAAARQHISRARKALAKASGEIEVEKDTRGGSNAKQPAPKGDTPEGEAAQAATAAKQQRQRDGDAPDTSKAGVQAAVDTLDAALAGSRKGKAADRKEAREQLVALAAFLGASIEA